MNNLKTETLKLHLEHKGKIAINSKIDVQDKEILSLVYSPGVAYPCLEIQNNYEDIYKYTAKSNVVGVVSDGSAVLGLGDIGAAASLPVMEGKAVLFKKFANIDAFPICIDTNDVEEFIKTVKLITTSFGGINLEDISAPRCFEIEEQLINELNIPVFHDDQHGTAVVTLAALINSLKLVNKRIEDVKIVVFGSGAAGISIMKLLHLLGNKQIVCYNKYGVVNNNTIKNNDKYVQQLFEQNIILNSSDDVLDLFENSDVFIGVSAANILTSTMIKKMNNQPIVLAMANPNPEIEYEKAKQAGAYIVGTGRSDYPNQVNNLLAFPGIFRGVLDAGTKKITDEMKIAAAKAIAKIITDDELTCENIIPSPFNKHVSKAVSKAVYDLARKD